LHTWIYKSSVSVGNATSLSLLQFLFILVQLNIIDKDSYPKDFYAKEDPPNSGKWKCGNCLDREIEDAILENTPNSERAREIIIKRMNT
jgi:hypothetical protein